MEDKIKCIYAIKDKRNDKVIYIGQTKDFKQRKTNQFRGKNTHISKYMYEQGRDNFEMFILKELNEDISKEEMLKIEDFYIVKYNTLKPNGFNMIRSGYVNSDKNYVRERHNKYCREVYEHTEKRKLYYKSDKYKEKKRLNEYYKSEKYKEKKRQYYLRRKALKQKEKNN